MVNRFPFLALLASGSLLLFTIPTFALTPEEIFNNRAENECDNKGASKASAIYCEGLVLGYSLGMNIGICFIYHGTLTRGECYDMVDEIVKRHMPSYYKTFEQATDFVIASILRYFDQ